MATRSIIGMEMPDGTVRSIYCHFDGYIEHHGPILVESYNTAEKVSALLDRGDLSTLNTTPESSGAYKDRGEGNVDAITYNDIDQFVNDIRSRTVISHIYLFRNEEWWLKDKFDGKTRNFKPVKILIM